jgi:hypothetical protein
MSKNRNAAPLVRRARVGVQALALLGQAAGVCAHAPYRRAVRPGGGGLSPGHPVRRGAPDRPGAGRSGTCVAAASSPASRRPLMRDTMT